VQESLLHLHPAHDLRSPYQGLSITELFERNPIWLRTSATLLDAAQLMAQNHIGDIIVVKEQNEKLVPVGMLTDRDIVVKAVARRIAAEAMKVSELMTLDVITAKDSSSLSEVMHLMSDNGVSRLPIVNEAGSLVGILTSKRLFQYLAQGLCELSTLSRQQLEREEGRH